MENTDTEILVENRDVKVTRSVTGSVIGRFMMDTADKSELSGPLSICIEHVVRTHVTGMLQQVAQHDTRFRGKLIPSGSFYEGTKVTTPNEFDYMYELSCFQTDAVQPIHIYPPVYRPMQEGIPHRGFFTLEFTSERAGSADGETSGETRDLLDADVILRAFFESLEAAATRQNEHEETMMSMNTVKRNGPAVTLSFNLNKPVFLENLNCLPTAHSKRSKGALSALKPTEVKNFNSFIKVDIVLAIPVALTELKLDEGNIETMFDEEDDTEILHLVPSGNCWKLSVAKLESHLIRSLTGVNWRPQETIIDVCEHFNTNAQNNDPDVEMVHAETFNDDVTRPHIIEMESYGGEDESHGQSSFDRSEAQVCRRSCLVALKHLRDQHEGSDLFKKAILPTYLLKVAFLQECREHPSDEDWAEAQLGRRVYNILDRVDTQSRDGTLTTAFLPNIPVLKSPNYNISKQVGSIISGLFENLRSYRECSAASAIACFIALIFAGYIFYSAIVMVTYVCCSQTGRAYLNKTEQRCVYFNAQYPCSKVRVPQDNEFEANQIWTLICVVIRSVWYIAVFIYRLTIYICRSNELCESFCNPITFQFFPAVISLLYITLSSSAVKIFEENLFLVAAFETFYLFYEVSSLISICLLRKRNQQIGQCVGPFRKCAWFYNKRPAEAYFEYMSRYS